MGILRLTTVYLLEALAAAKFRTLHYSKGSNLIQQKMMELKESWFFEKTYHISWWGLKKHVFSFEWCIGVS